MAKKLPVIIVIFLAILAVRNLLAPGLPPTHDGEYHIIRFYEFNKALQGDQWYPRWAPDLNKGYGVPLFNYVYPLPNYFAALLHFLGISFIDAFKLNMFLATIIGALFMYLWSRKFWGNWAGLVSSIFYTYSPYHFLDIYIRGSVGEVWALAFFPAILWSITKFLRDRNFIFLPISSLFLALIIFSHNILSLMFFPFAVFYAMFLIYKGKKRIYLLLNTFYIILIGLGLSGIFWLPAIFERNYVHGLDVFDYRQHFVEIYQLIFPSWGSGFSADPTTQGLSFQIGIANLVVLLLSILLLRKSRLVIFIFLWIFLAILLMLKISQPIWDQISLMQYFQFPWRFLSIIILCTSFLAGIIVYFWRSAAMIWFLIFMAVILGIGYSKPAYYHLRDDNYYITRSNFIDGTNSPGNTFNTIWFNESLEKASLPTHIAYFPGWQVFADGEKIPTGVDKDGLIQFRAPLGANKVELKFLDTPIRNLSKLISGISLIIIFLLFVKSFHVRIR